MLVFLIYALVARKINKALTGKIFWQEKKMKRSFVVFLIILIMIGLFISCGGWDTGYKNPLVEEKMARLEETGKPDGIKMAYTVFEIYEIAIKDILELTKNAPTDDKTYEKLKQMQLYYFKTMWYISLHYKKLTDPEQADLQQQMSILANAGPYLSNSGAYMERLNDYYKHKRFLKLIEPMFSLYGLFREDYIQQRHPEIYAEIAK